MAALLCQIFYVFMECFLQTQNKIQARTPQTLIRTKQLKQNPVRITHSPKKTQNKIKAKKKRQLI